MKIPINQIDTNDKGRILAVQPILEEYFRKIGKNHPVEEARGEILFRSMDICNNDLSLLDANGLPLDKKQFRLLERRISRFLSLADIDLTLFESTEIDPKDLVEIRGQVESRVNNKTSERGALENVFDSNDEIIGQYISQLEDAFARLGTSSDNLLHNNSSLKSKRHAEVLQVCFSVARDMILVIGPEKYNEVRLKIGLVLFQKYSAEEVISSASNVLAQNEQNNNPRGFWNQLPRVWVEELMILAKNPEIVQQICDYKGYTHKKSVRKHIDFFNKQKEGKKKLKKKMTQVEYFEANVKDNDFTDPTCAFTMLERQQDIKLPLIQYSKNYSSFEIADMQQLRRQFFSGFNKERALRAIRNFCAVLSNYDEAFRECHNNAVLKKSSVASQSTLNSARAALKDSVRLLKEKKIEPIRQNDSSLTFVVKADFGNGDGEPYVDVFANKPPRIISKNVNSDDISETFSGIEGLRDKIGMVLQMFKDMESRIEESKNTLSEKQLYADYAVIKYCISVYKSLYADIKNENN